MEKEYADKSGAFVIDSDVTFNKYLGPRIDRTFQSLIFLTISGDHPSFSQCLPCASIGEALSELTDSLYSTTEPLLVFIVYLDKSRAAGEAFRVQTVPHLALVDSGKAELSSFFVQGSRGIFLPSAEGEINLFSWMNALTGRSFRAPLFSYRMFTWRNSLLAVLGLALLSQLPFFWRNRGHPLIWLVVTYLFYISTLSGHVYNAIHSTPLYTVDQSGSTSWFLLHNMRSQYRLEGIALAAVMMLGSLAWIVGADSVTRVRSPTLRSVLVIVFFLIALYLFFITTNFFALKFPGYPYSLRELRRNIF